MEQQRLHDVLQHGEQWLVDLWADLRQRRPAEGDATGMEKLRGLANKADTLGTQMRRLRSAGRAVEEACVLAEQVLALRRALVQEIDDVLAGFLRGQGLVCVFLAFFYAAGLALVGLQHGAIIGLLTGLFSFIPYVGMFGGVVVGLTVAAFQFGTLWQVAMVAAVVVAVVAWEVAAWEAVLRWAGWAVAVVEEWEVTVWKATER